MDIKQEVLLIVERLPDAVLVEVLDYLRRVEKDGSAQAHRAQMLDSILTEDRDMLGKLAK